MLFRILFRCTSGFLPGAVQDASSEADEVGGAVLQKSFRFAGGLDAAGQDDGRKSGASSFRESGTDLPDLIGEIAGFLVARAAIVTETAGDVKEVDAGVREGAGCFRCLRQTAISGARI